MHSQAFRDHLNNDLIPFWNKLRDDTHGGFYGYVGSDLSVDEYADKGVILNSRILWFYSASYRLLKEPGLLDMAAHGFRFLADCCYDKEYGGVYWSMKYDGTPSDDTKHTYNQAFAIYALTAYYNASGDCDALELAYKLFELIEDVCRDEGGYLEAFLRDFAPDSNEKLSENGVMAERTMNTLLHVLEAYTELYRVDGEKKVEQAIRRILAQFMDDIYNPEQGILDVFFDREFNSIIDLESYGHDIEASWLIDRACDVLGDESVTARIRPMTAALARTTYRNAYDIQLHALYNEREGAAVDRQKVWWVQAESVVGFYNAWQKDKTSEELRTAAADIWQFIQDRIIDRRCGEWIENLLPDGTADNHRGIVHLWKCPYHNGRMCIEMASRLSKDENK